MRKSHNMAPEKPPVGVGNSIRMASGIFLGFLMALGLMMIPSSRDVPELGDGGGTYDLTHEVRLGRGGALVNPLLDYLSPSTTAPTLLSLKEEILDVAQNYAAREELLSFSLYFRELDTGRWFGINEDNPYRPASLLKVHILLDYLKLAESDSTLLGQMVLARELSPDAINRPNLPPLEPGHEYPVRELLERMIVHSDNAASEILVEHLVSGWNREALDSLSQGIDLVAPTLAADDGNLVVSARSYAGVFRVLYNATYLGKEMSEVGLELLARSSFDAGLAGGVPAGVTVANKYGFGGDPDDPTDYQFHDCGIVYADPSPYLLCVFTRTTGDRVAHELISAVSRTVWDHLHESEARPGRALPSSVTVEPAPGIPPRSN